MRQGRPGNEADVCEADVCETAASYCSGMM